MKRSLSVNDTNVLKGVALLLLLVHHLFYVQDGYYDDLLIARGHYFVQEIGIASKLCVAVFVFLSGYGLAAKADKTGGIRSLKEFYLQRYAKLLMNYWFIWFVFVPIGVFVFGRDLNEVYGDHTTVKFILDLFGLLNCFGMYGYNLTWWFYSCIILLYAIFPFIYRMRQNMLLVILCGMAISFLPISLIIGPIKFYILAFVIGVCSSNRLIVSCLYPPPTYKRVPRYCIMEHPYVLAYCRKAIQQLSASCGCSHCMFPFCYISVATNSQLHRESPFFYWQAQHEHIPVPHFHLLLLVQGFYLSHTKSPADIHDVA